MMTATDTATRDSLLRARTWADVAAQDPYRSDLVAVAQVYATLAIAEQLARIADAAERTETK